jgi:hypothetical protein
MQLVLIKKLFEPTIRCLNPDYALEMRKRFRNFKLDFCKSDNIY